MRRLPLAIAICASLFLASPAMACRLHSASVQMLFEAAPDGAPEGTRMFHGRFTNQGPQFEEVRAMRPFVDVPGDFDAPLLGIVEVGEGVVVGVYEVMMTSCNWLFGRDRVFDLDAWIVGRPLPTHDGSIAIDPVGRRVSGGWTEF